MNKLRKLILTVVLPLTIILFGTFTKWNYIYVEDGPDDFLYGFPFAFICSGWHTSLSLQIFITEFVSDFLVYFTLCFVLILLLDRFVKPFFEKRYLKIGLIVFATLTLIFYGVIFSNPDNRFEWKKDFKYKEIRTGYKFVWQQDKR